MCYKEHREFLPYSSFLNLILIHYMPPALKQVILATQVCQKMSNIGGDVPPAGVVNVERSAGVYKYSDGWNCIFWSGLSPAIYDP